MIKEWNGLEINYENDRFITDVLSNEEYKFLFRYPVVIDIGCHIGTFSLYMLDHADKIYAIEPSKENLTLMNQTIKDNDIKSIKTFQLAVSNKEGIGYIHTDGTAGGGGWKLDSILGTLPVNMVTLEGFMDSEGIDYADLVKLDVEGGEMDIIAEDNFPFKRIGTIIGEHHYANGNQIPFFNKLERMGYRCTEYNGNHFIARHI